MAKARSTPRPEADIRLLADARLMAGYATRIGRLQNGTILDSIDKLEAAPTSGPEHDKAFNELSWALNVLAQALAPVTLMDLGSEWQPYPQHRLDAKVRPFIAVAAALLIAVLGYFTFIYTEARLTSTALVALQSQQLTEKSEHLYDHYLQVLPGLPPKSPEQRVAAASFYQEVDLLKNLQDQLYQSTHVADRLRDQANPLTVVVLVSRVLEPKSAAAATAAAPAAKASAANAPDTIMPADLTLTASQIVAQNQDRSGYDQVLPDGAAPTDAVATPTPTPPALAATLEYYNDLTAFLSSIGIPDLFQDPNKRVETQIAIDLQHCNDFISVLGQWVLPALYGLFGALVFHLRSMMNPMIATPNLIVVRGALAMMAGVSIAWLFNAMVGVGAANPGGVTAFGLAFVFGYSIDVFFKALDKVVMQFSK
jgi:hypothetical protein